MTLKISLLIYDLQSEYWINTYIVEGLSKGTQATKKVSSEMKCINENMTWNTQDTNLSWCVPNAYVNHTIRGQGTAISTLGHSATTSRAQYTIISSKACLLSYYLA